MRELIMDFAAVGDAVRELETIAGQVEVTLDDLRRHVHHVAGSWEGAAHQGFAATIATWDRAASDLHRGLGELRNHAATGHNNHVGAVRTNATIWTLG